MEAALKTRGLTVDGERLDGTRRHWDVVYNMLRAADQYALAISCAEIVSDSSMPEALYTVLGNLVDCRTLLWPLPTNR
jgi:hypothetical protein